MVQSGPGDRGAAFLHGGKGGSLDPTQGKAEAVRGVLQAGLAALEGGGGEGVHPAIGPLFGLMDQGDEGVGSDAAAAAESGGDHGLSATNWVTVMAGR